MIYLRVSDFILYKLYNYIFDLTINIKMLSLLCVVQWFNELGVRKKPVPYKSAM